MRILILTHTFSDKVIGGEARISWELSHALAKRDLKIFVVSSFVEKGAKAKLPKNLKVYKTPFCHPAAGLDNSNMLRMFFYSIPLIFLKKIDIIYLASSNGPCPFSKFKFGRLFVESADIAHDYDNPKIKDELWHDRKRKNEAMGNVFKPGFFEKIFDKLTNWFYAIFKLDENYPKGVDLFACRAKSVMDFLKKQGHKAKLAYVPNGVDVKEFHPKNILKKKKNKFTFLFVGKLTKTKGLIYLIEAFKKLSQEKKDIELILIGEGASSTEREIKEKSENADNIHFLGVKPADEIKNYYSLCDVFIMPSLSEGFGIANLEAMASAKPVISTSVGGIKDVVINEETGLLVNPAETEELYNAMKKLVEHPDLLKKMGEKARKRVIDYFSWDKIAEKLEQAYKVIIKT